MPELPEVETVVRGLKKSLTQERILRLELSDKSFRLPYPKTFKNDVQNAEIKQVYRRAKYIIIELGNNKNIIIHLGMSGKVLVGDNIPPKKHDHARFFLASGKQFVFNDPRRFGLITLVDVSKPNWGEIFGDLGIEPLSEALSGESLKSLIGKSNLAIKLFIMDAKRVVGIGNIYASEILYRTKISPLKPAQLLTLTQCNALSNNIKDVLNEAIVSGGSTLRDYVQSSGGLGYFQHKFLVYGKTDQPCQKCAYVIKKIVMQGRSTFYCPNCQK